MSSAIFPTQSQLPGLTYDVQREPVWSGTEVIEAASGKETAIAYQSSPRYQWTLNFEFLRKDRSELQLLFGFFNSMKANFDTFLFTDVDDFSVVGQVIGAGDGASTGFQLLRSFGNAADPILAPNAVSAVYFNGMLQDVSAYTVSQWGVEAPGVITFIAAPGVGVVVSADFTYYWPCRFVDRSLTFKKFMNLLWSSSGVKFKSVK